jgi:hypothetical protein
MRSSATQPRVNGRFVATITDAQIVHLQELVRSAKVSTGHRINVRSALKRFVSRSDATREITRLQRIVRA